MLRSESEEDETREQDEIALVSNSSNATSGVTGCLLLTAWTCVIGTSFQFGFATGVINAPQQIIEDFFNSSQIEKHGGNGWSKATMIGLWSLTVGIFLVGGIVGGLTSGVLLDKFSRKTIMYFINIPILCGAICLLISKLMKEITVLIIGRFLLGVGSGWATAVASTFLTEISPIHLRGAMGTLNQFFIVFGILVSQLLGLNSVLGTVDGWFYLLGLSMVPCFIQLMTLPCIPESPRYLLLVKKDMEETRKALQRLRGTTDIETDIAEITSENTTLEKVSVIDLFKSPWLRKPLLVAVVMQLSQQLSGINAVIYYSTSIFESAGFSVKDSQYATISTGVVNLVMTFIAALLMDKAGRRVLHLLGLIGMFVFSVLLTVSQALEPKISAFSYLSIVAVLMFVVSFAIGPGSIPWFITAELFAQNSRPAAMSVAVFTNWTANCLVGFLFPQMQEHLGFYSFVPFSCMLFLSVLFTYFKVPETKGRTIEDITHEYGASYNRIE